MCPGRIPSKALSSRSWRTEDERQRYGGEKKVNSKAHTSTRYHYCTPLHVTTVNRGYRLNREYVDLFISTCMHAYTRTRAHAYTKMHITSGYDRRFVEWTGHGLPSLISVGSSPDDEGKLILHTERMRGDIKPSGSGHSRIIARGVRESRPELGAPSFAKSVFSIASFIRPTWSNPIAIVAADRVRQPTYLISPSSLWPTTEFALIYARLQIKREIESFLLSSGRVSILVPAASGDRARW